jgi:hypothetical protein
VGDSAIRNLNDEGGGFAQLHRPFSSETVLISQPGGSSQGITPLPLPGIIGRPHKKNRLGHPPPFSERHLGQILT